MIHQTLAIIMANVGIGCLAYSYYLLRSFKDRVDNFTEQEMERTLLERDIVNFARMIRRGEVTFQMITDFYERFVKVNEPHNRLKRAWKYFVLAGFLFIMTSVVGLLNGTYGWFTDIVAYYLLSIGVMILFFAFRDLMYLGNSNL